MTAPLRVTLYLIENRRSVSDVWNFPLSMSVPGCGLGPEYEDETKGTARSTAILSVSPYVTSVTTTTVLMCPESRIVPAERCFLTLRSWTDTETAPSPCAGTQACAKAPGAKMRIPESASAEATRR